MKEVILAGFDGKNNPARMIVEKADVKCRRLILPNDREKAAQLLREETEKDFTVCIVILGQRPRICDKIAIEATAKRGCDIRRTGMDVSTIRQFLKETGYEAYLSKGCGSAGSYCNHTYYEALGMRVNSVFLHVPNMDNISDLGEITKAVSHLVNNLAAVPALL